MKKKLMIILAQLCFIGVLMILPVLIQVTGNNVSLILSLVGVSKSKAIILLIALLIGMCLEKTGHYKLASIMGGITIPYVGWLLLVTHAYADDYTGGNITMICNYGVYVLLLAYLIAYIWLCVKRIREKVREAQKNVLACSKVVRFYAMIVFCMVLVCGVFLYVNIADAKDFDAENAGNEMYCWAGNILVEVKDYDKQEKLYEANQNIKIPYKVSCAAGESYYLYLPDNDNIEFNIEGKQKVSGEAEIDIEFKVKNDGANEIDFTFMTDSETPEMEMKFYVYTYTEDGMTFVDFNCMEYAEEAYYKWMLEQGEIDFEEYDRIMEERHTLNDADVSIEVYPG